MRIAAALIAALTLSACSTLENAADRVHDLAAAHPVIVAAGTSIVVSSAITVYAMHRAKDQLQDQMAAAIAQQQAALGGQPVMHK